MRILFFGSGALALPALDALLPSAHHLLAVVTAPDRPAGRGRRMTATPVAVWAAAHGLPLFQPSAVQDPDFALRLRALAPDLIIAIAFGQKIPDELLALAPHGGINLHPSLLPAFRGAAPVPRAILCGLEDTGISVIRLSAIMDGGDILAARRAAIAADETAGELHDRLAAMGAPLLVDVVDQLAAGKAAATAQDHALASRAPKLDKSMAWVDLHQPAAAVSSRIRGLSPWPGCRAEFIAPDGARRIDVLLLKCRQCAAVDPVAGRPHQEPRSAVEPGAVLPDLSIACQSGAVELLQIQPLGRRIMDIAAFANGYGLKPGWTLHSSPIS